MLDAYVLHNTIKLFDRFILWRHKTQSTNIISESKLEASGIDKFIMGVGISV